MKERLDVLLTERGYFPSREKARAAVMEGRIFIKDRRFDKPGMSVPSDSEIEIRGDSCPYVSRGGYKLQRALDVFRIDVKGFSCIDIGASTGGFTDCLLQRGAGKVYSVDVGYGQLDWKLRSDPRVVVMEKTNFRYFKPDAIPEKADFVCGDVSFISLRHIFPAAAPLLKEGGKGVFLVKPQFEAGREQVGKHGIIRDPGVHLEVLEAAAGYASASGFGVLDANYSPIKGPAGNIEFLLLTELGAKNAEGLSERLSAAVEEAHRKLD